MEFPKYPRTFHLQGSKGMVDPTDAPFLKVLNHNLVVEEKVDGSCVGIGFSDGKIMIKHRNQDVRGDQWDLLKYWISEHQEMLYDRLREKYIMYGEWLYARHSLFYDNLPHYFLEYDIFDTCAQKFLTTTDRYNLLHGTPIISVHVLGSGIFKKSTEIIELFGQSNSRIQGLMEGLYLKIEENSEVIARYKYISKEFLEQILHAGTHWSSRRLEKNYVR